MSFCCCCGGGGVCCFAFLPRYISRHPEREFLLRVSMSEIGNETVRDLLVPPAALSRGHHHRTAANSSSSGGLDIVDDPQRGAVVKNLTERIVASPAQVCLNVCLFVCLFVFLFCLFVCLFVCFVCLFVCLFHGLVSGVEVQNCGLGLALVLRMEWQVGVGVVVAGSLDFELL